MTVQPNEDESTTLTITPDSDITSFAELAVFPEPFATAVREADALVGPSA